MISFILSFLITVLNAAIVGFGFALGVGIFALIVYYSHRAVSKVRK